MSAGDVKSKETGWGLPIAVVVIAHLCLAAIPVEFPPVESDEDREERSLAMVPAPDLKPPAEEPDRVEEPVPEEPQPEPIDEPVAPPEPPAESDVVVAEEPVEEPVDEPEPADPVLDDDPLADMDTLDFDDDFEPVERPPLERVEPEPDAPDVDWQGYGRQVMESVQTHKNYPRMAERMGWEGEASVRVTIDRSGALADAPGIVDSSTHDTLDEEVVRMVESAAPFEAFPGASSEEQREFVIPVRFRLES